MNFYLHLVCTRLIFSLTKHLTLECLQLNSKQYITRNNNSVHYGWIFIVIDTKIAEKKTSNTISINGHTVVVIKHNKAIAGDVLWARVEPKRRNNQRYEIYHSVYLLLYLYTVSREAR